MNVNLAYAPCQQGFMKRLYVILCDYIKVT